MPFSSISFFLWTLLQHLPTTLQLLPESARRFILIFPFLRLPPNFFSFFFFVLPFSDLGHRSTSLPCTFYWLSTIWEFSLHVTQYCTPFCNPLKKHDLPTVSPSFANLFPGVAVGSWLGRALSHKVFLGFLWVL